MVAPGDVAPVKAASWGCRLQDASVSGNRKPSPPFRFLPLKHIRAGSASRVAVRRPVETPASLSVCSPRSAPDPNLSPKGSPQHSCGVVARR